MRRPLLLALLFALTGWALTGCLSRPALDPVGGFELSPTPDREEWSELGPLDLRTVLRTARSALAPLQQYTATLETRERLEDDLFPRRVMHLQLREEPFSVAIETSEPESESGQRVWFDESENDGELLAETPGFLGTLVGVLSLDPEGDLAMENRRHPITDIGLERLLAQVEVGFAPSLEAREVPRVRVAELDLGGRPVRLVEALVRRELPDASLLYRLGFERSSGLLLYYGLAELFPDGPALVEEYLYREVAPATLTDADFRPAR